MHTLSDFQLSEGVYFPNPNTPSQTSQPKQLWEKIAAEYYADPNRTDEYVPANLPLSGDRGGVWRLLPPNQQFNSILEIGCGYGRASIYLSKRKNFTCRQYYGLDISETMLRNLLKYKAEYNFYPGAEFYPICMSAGEELPLADNSIDLVISDSVFMHITYEQVQKTLAEVCRVLKPNGSFIFHNSFYNKSSPKHVIHNLFRVLAFWRVNPIYLKQYSLADVEQLIQASQLASKCPGYSILPSEPSVIPAKVAGVPVPLASFINYKIKYPESWKETLARTYTVYSSHLTGPQST